MADRGRAMPTWSPTPIGSGKTPGVFTDGPARIYDVIWSLRGVTRDALGVPLGGVTVDVFRSLPPHEWIGSTVSKADGSYQFSYLPDGVTNFFIVTYLDGAPDVAGCSVNTLVGS